MSSAVRAVASVRAADLGELLAVEEHT